MPEIFLPIFNFFYTYITKIKNNAGVPYGKIFKQWNGCSGLHGNDKFRLEFPNGINEKTKALLIGATMLVVSLKF